MPRNSKNKADAEHRIQTPRGSLIVGKQSTCKTTEGKGPRKRGRCEHTEAKEPVRKQGTCRNTEAQELYSGNKAHAETQEPSNLANKFKANPGTQKH